MKDKKEYLCVHIFSHCSDENKIESFPFLLARELGKTSKNLCIVTRKKPTKEDKNRSMAFFCPYYLTPIVISTKKSKNIRVVSRLNNIFTIPLFIISKITGKKILCQPDISPKFLPHYTNKILKNIPIFFRRRIISANLRLADKIILATPYEKEVLEEVVDVNPQKIEFIPLGSKINISNTKKQSYILSVAQAWTDRKNLHTALEVFSQIPKSIRPKFIIVGEFTSAKYFIESENRYENGLEYKKKIEDIIKARNLQDDVQFVGSKIGKELEDLFAGAKVFFLPTKQETFGMVFVEAMSKGTPCVAMSNSAVKYIIKDGTTGYLKNSAQELKDAIVKLLTDKKQYLTMRSNCIRESKQYTWTAVAQKWEKILNGK